jgi:hypothetical protein
MVFYQISRTLNKRFIYVQLVVVIVFLVKRKHKRENREHMYNLLI